MEVNEVRKLSYLSSDEFFNKKINEVGNKVCLIIKAWIQPEPWSNS